ncbi:hypothetical protein A3I40_02635 [Candidatus Uhrbacteria bacterium RIFCSPLOWO2_02_FULL_48_12]|uniref:Phage-Barnase-EndoU-ColicinE5/D-RelE like nuclease 3 domain-containing protein n=1 Tax=Candidatus Uhrbacteria bacterium RIFCSPLOWO2_02_FULL_48_12 TaxID=1802407 RepID=A0A1F7VBT6_9BACT|nr:MAG: hypothetical protein A3I40_02635 [Candidatus Uhrbacteria bacterium RIFCSPLOWO2_02_FULL_48_12]
MLGFTDEQFKEVKEKGEALYKSLGEVYCPYFKEKVSFNAKGLEHLKFKKKHHARSAEDQYVRFRILKLAPEILKQTKTIQGISEQKVFELNRSNQRNEYVMADALYYEFVAILEKTRVRVIVKQIGTAPKYFWSVIPFWKINKENGKRKLHYGSPEYD